MGNETHVPSVTTANGLKRVEVNADARNGVRFSLPDGEWIELHWRNGDQELTLYASATLVIKPVASNTCRLEVERW